MNKMPQNPVPSSQASDQDQMPFKVNWGLVVAVLVWLGLALLMQWNKTYTNAWQLGLAGVLVLMLASARSVPRK